MNELTRIAYRNVLAIAAGLAIALTSGCATVDISLLPMYGDAEKTAEQIQADKTYLDYMDARFDDRRAASKTAARAGWNYWYAGDWQTAMRRFNQSWLLDPDNFDAYWGYVVILGVQGKYRESSDMGDIALDLEPRNHKLLCDVAYSYGNYAAMIKFSNAEKEKYLQKAFAAYARGAAIAPGQPCMSWAATLYNDGQYLAAWEKVRQAEDLGYHYPPQFLKELSGKLPRPTSL